MFLSQIGIDETNIVVFMKNLIIAFVIHTWKYEHIFLYQKKILMQIMEIMWCKNNSILEISGSKGHLPSYRLHRKDDNHNLLLGPASLGPASTDGGPAWRKLRSRGSP